MAMNMVHLDRAQARLRTRRLRDISREGGGVARATLLLLLDAVAAIGFAGGLAGAVAALAGHRGFAAWLLLLFGSGVVRAFVLFCSARVGAAGARGAKSALRRRVVAAGLRQPFGTSTTGGAINAVVDEVEALDGYVARFMPMRAAAAIAPMLVLAAVALASPIAAAVMIATLIPFVAAMILAGSAAADESRRQFDAMARLSSVFVDRVRALPVILAFGAEQAQTRAIGRAADDVARRTMRVLARAFLSSGALEFFAALSVALVAVYAGFNLLGILPFPVPEHLTLGRAFFVLALAPEFYMPLRRLAAAYHDKQAAETAIDRLDPTGTAAAPALPPAPRITMPPAIRFEDVTIRYPGATADAVSHFSASVGAGETLALLGPSGSGKSSLLHLLLGLVSPTGGAIRLDGVRLDARGGLSAGWAGQHSILIADTIARNIALGRGDASPREIERAALAAGLGPAIDRRARGIDTVLDERGGGLSGGERRRVGLARALLTGAPLLLLDEPTAHLDAAAEAALIDTIAEAARGRTLLIATHSRALAAIADHVVELDRICA